MKGSDLGACLDLLEAHLAANEAGERHGREIRVAVLARIRLLEALGRIVGNSREVLFDRGSTRFVLSDRRSGPLVEVYLDGRVLVHGAPVSACSEEILRGVDPRGIVERLASRFTAHAQGLNGSAERIALERNRLEIAAAILDR